MVDCDDPGCGPGKHSTALSKANTCPAFYARKLQHTNEWRRRQRATPEGRELQNRKSREFKQREYATPDGYIRERLRSARRRAAAVGVPFTLTLETTPPIPELCPIFGTSMTRQTGKGAHPNSPSLDRIIPALGYVQGNVQWISNRANIIKSDATPEELMLVAQYMARLMGASDG